MDLKEYKKVCQIIEMEEARVENAKRPSYVGTSTDVLHNFKRDGQLQGISPLQNLLAHYLKQVAAIISWVRNPDIPPSEPLLSRVVDARVYPKLLLALAQDERNVLYSDIAEEAKTPMDIPWGKMADALEAAEQRDAMRNIAEEHPVNSGSSIRTNFPGYMS